MDSYESRICNAAFGSPRSVPRDETLLRERVLAQNESALDASRQIADIVSAIPETPNAKGQKPHALIVGGFVRDAILGLHPKDADLEVYGVEADTLVEKLEQHFPGQVEVVGKAYGVIKVGFDADIDIDIAIPRPPFSDNRAAHESADPSLTPKEGGQLRDYSVNNVAADPYTGEVYDWWGGIDDLQSHILRATYPEFFELDLLRAWRGAQFSARLQLEPDAATKALLRNMLLGGDSLEVEPYQRRLQLKKLFLKAPFPSLGLCFMRDTGFFERYDCALLEVSESNLPAWEHTLQLLDRVAAAIDILPMELDESDILRANSYAMSRGIVGDKQQDIVPAVASFVKAFGFGKQHAAAVTQLQLHTDAFARFISPEKKKPKQTKGRPGTFIARPSQTPQLESKRLEALLTDAHPAHFTLLFLCAVASDFSHPLERAIEEKSEQLNSFTSLIENPPKRVPLLSKEDLTRRLRVPRGAHIGLMLGEIEKNRYELVTRERALAFVKDVLVPKYLKP